MYDPYSLLRTRANQESLKRAGVQTTWQDAIRQNKDNDLPVQLRCTFLESLLYSFAADLKACLHQYRINLIDWRRRWVEDLHIKRHTAIHR